MENVRPVKRSVAADGEHSQNDNRLSRKDFRWKLMDTLRNSGMEDRLKTQLRSYIVAELRKNNDPRGVIFRPGPAGPTSSLVERAVDSLIVDYLKARGNEFTLSVFLPECGMNQGAQVLSQEDVLRVLHLDRADTMALRLREIISTTDGATIVKLLHALSQLRSTDIMDREIQTECDPDDLVELQIRRVDKGLGKLGASKQVLASVVEERLTRYKNELELRLQNEMDEQLCKFKEIEIAQLRVEERQKYSAEIAHLKADHELRLVEQRQRRVEEEEEARRRLEDRERELEKSNMELRQKLLEASNRSVLAESQLRAEAEIKLRTVGLERESLERRLEEALTQVRELTGFRDTYATRMQEAIAQYKIDLNREHAEVLSNAEVEKARVQAERAVLEEKARAVERMMMQVKESHDEMDSLRNGLKQSKVELRAVLAERDDALHQIKELKLQVNTQSSTSALEFELQSLKMQLMQAEKTTEKWQTEHQNLLRDMMQPRNDHEKEIAKLRKSEAKWQRECQELVTKLDVEISRGEELERKYEDEMLTNKELKREISELRLALHRLQVKKDGASIADFDRAMPWPFQNGQPASPFRKQPIPDPLLFTQSPVPVKILDPTDSRSFWPQNRSHNHTPTNVSPLRRGAGMTDSSKSAFEPIASRARHSGGHGFGDAWDDGFAATSGIPALLLQSHRESHPAVSNAQTAANSSVLPPVEMGGAFLDETLKSLTIPSNAESARSSYRNSPIISRRKSKRSTFREDAPTEELISPAKLQEVSKNGPPSSPKASSANRRSPPKALVERSENLESNEKPEPLPKPGEVSQSTDDLAEKQRREAEDNEAQLLRDLEIRALEESRRELELREAARKREQEAERQNTERQEAERQEKERLRLALEQEAREREAQEVRQKEKQLEEKRAREEEEEKRRAREREAYERRRMERERRDRELEELQQADAKKEADRIRLLRKRESEAEEIRQAEAERQRAEEAFRKMRESEEEKRKRADQEKEAEELKWLDDIGADPQMQKYINVVLEKRHEPAATQGNEEDYSKGSSVSFGAGDTIDEVSAPSSHSVNDDAW